MFAGSDGGLPDARTRWLLLKATLELLQSRQFDDFDVEDISHVAGVIPETFHRYFPSKNDVLEELRREFNEDFVAEALASWSESPCDVETYIELLAPKFLDYVAKHAVFVGAYIRQRSDVWSGERGASLLAEIEAFISDLFLRHNRRGRFVEGRLVIGGMLAMWLRVALQCMDESPQERAKHADLLGRLSKACLSVAVA